MAAPITRGPVSAALATLARCAALLTLAASPAGAVYVPRPELPEEAARAVDYRIDVRLDPATKRLSGNSVALWAGDLPPMAQV